MQKTLLFLVALAFMACQAKKTPVDLLVVNAKVYTVDSTFTVAEAFAVHQGKFVAVGKQADLLAKYEPSQTLDAQGQFIYPGLNDGHCHFYGLGQVMQSANLVGTQSYNEVLQRVADFASTHPEQPWILGRGWDQNDWDDKQFPTKELLDKLTDGRPILLTRIDGHAALANSKALALAGITEKTQVEGGKVLTSNGKPTGVLIDNAVDLVSALAPKPKGMALERMLLEAQDACIKYGLTSVTDAGLTLDIIQAIDSLQKAGKLKIRIYAMIDPLSKEHFLANGPMKTERLHVRSFKIYADGALGSRGAALLQPYSDDSKNNGLLLSSRENMKAMMVAMRDAGFQVNTHCIGDSANRLILDLYGELLGEGNDRRWRIEHAQVVALEDQAKFKRFGVIPSVQPTHATSDMYWAGERLGPERVKTAYPFQQLLEQAGVLVFGTDFPVEEVSPFYTFHAAVARQDAKGFPAEGFQMENAVSRENTLRGMTIWPAFASFEEKEKGSIEVGKVADFIILSEDLMAVPKENMRQMQVQATYIGGELVFKKP